MKLSLPHESIITVTGVLFLPLFVYSVTLGLLYIAGLILQVPFNVCRQKSPAFDMLVSGGGLARQNSTKFLTS